MFAPQSINNLMPVALLCTRQCSHLLTLVIHLIFARVVLHTSYFPSLQKGKLTYRQVK